MHKLLTTLLLLFVIINTSNSQSFKYYQAKGAPKFIKNGSVSDTLLNPFAGGLNTPQFSNIDWNNDGKQDLFIFDKEALKPLAYLYDANLGKFTHAPQYEGAFTNYFSGWALLRDYNFDGKPDLYTSSVPYNKITLSPFIPSEKIQLFVNTTTQGGKTTFKQYSNVLFDTGMYVGPPYNQYLSPGELVAVSNAIPAIDDLDGDGDEDIISNQGITSTFWYYENFKKNKFNTPFSNDTTIFVPRDLCWGFIDYDFINHRFFLGFRRDQSSQCDYNMWGKRRHVDQSSLLIDLNGDGIKDLVFGDSEHRSFVSLINGRLQNSRQIDSIISQDTLFLSSNNTRKNFIEFPAAYYVDINADGKKELLVTTNKNFASKSVNNIWVHNATRVNSNLQFTATDGNDFLYKDMIDHGLRSVPVFIDIDNDGDKDLVVATSGVLEQTGNNNDRLYLYLNITDSVKPVFKLLDSNFVLSSFTGQGCVSAHPTFGDLNGDGKPDLLIGEGNGNIAYFINNSNGSQYNFTLNNRNAFNLTIATYCTPQLIDLDKDGLLDIVSGERNGTVKYYKNIGTKQVPSFSNIPTIDSLGKVNSRDVYYPLGSPQMLELVGYSAPHITDLNNDGIYEMLLGSNNGRVDLYTHIYANKDSVAKKQNNVYVDFSLDANAGYNKKFGMRTTAATAYLNGDSLQDIIIGNVSGGLVFMGSGVSPVNSNNELFLDNNAFVLYPNPAKSSVSLMLNRTSLSDINYLIYDISGKKIMEGTLDKNQTNTSINLGVLNPGLYLVQLTTNQWQSTQRLMISH